MTATALDSSRIFDYRTCERFLIEAVAHYEQSAPAVYQYLGELYTRLNEHSERVSVFELVTVTKLLENGIWDQPNYACNRIYHMLDLLGRDTSGLLGF